MKKWLIIATIMIKSLQVFAFDEVVVFSDAKLTDIKIKDSSILRVYPLVTIMNEKNTLFFHPQNIGTTEVCLLKNNKDLVVFNVEVREDETIIEGAKDFDILAIDSPPDVFELDLPPLTLKGVE